MTVIVAGAGIGGLVAGLSLHQAGIDVRVYEAVRAIQPLGVGIDLLPHAVRELFELGFEEGSASLGVQTAALAYFSKRGQEIWREPRGLAAGYNFTSRSRIHRGVLQHILLAAAIERLGEGHPRPPIAALERAGRYGPCRVPPPRR